MMQNVLTDRTLTFKKNKILGLYRLARSLEVLKQSKKVYFTYGSFHREGEQGTVLYYEGAVVI